MKIMKTIGTAILVSLCCTVCAGAFSLPQTVRANWKTLSHNLKLTAQLRSALENVASDGKAEEEKKISEANEQTRQILVHSDSLDYMNQERPKIEENLKAENDKLDELHEQRMTALDQAAFDKQIQDTLAKKEALNKELMRLYDIIAKEYAPIFDKSAADDVAAPKGAIRTGEDVKQLLATPLGKDILQNLTVFSNVKIVTEMFGERMVAEPNNMKLAQDYHDLYISLLDVLILCQEEYAGSIAGKWHPKLAEIEKNAQATLDKVKKSAETPSLNERQKELMRKNVETNELTLKAVQLYKKFLEQQELDTQKKIADLKNDREVLVMTKLTLKNAVDVLDVIRSSQQILNSLAALTMPDLQLYSNEGLRQAFDQISRMMQQ